MWGCYLVQDYMRFSQDPTDLADQNVKVSLEMLKSSQTGWLCIPEKIKFCSVLSPKPAANMFEPWGKERTTGQCARDMNYK